jgi:hypothetical protein
MTGKDMAIRLRFRSEGNHCDVDVAHIILPLEGFEFFVDTIDKDEDDDNEDEDGTGVSLSTAASVSDG